MKKATYLCIALIGIDSLFFHSMALSWDNDKTHRDLSKIAAEQSNLNKNKGNYLINLGIKDELLELLKWRGDAKYVIDWLQEGAYDEDAGSRTDAFWGSARFNNHFHNPLKEWNEAGLNESITIVIPTIPYHYTRTIKGESALKWAQDSSNQSTYAESKKLQGDQTWQATKGHYYKALTAQKPAEREAEFARTFKGLGHQMHLIQDMAVPAHVRNDAHPEDSELGRKYYFIGDMYFETWAKKNSPYINSYAAQPVTPDVNLSITVPGGLSPITQFYDADQYTESFVPSTSPTWGLSEYTNANFVSDDTIFTERFDKNDRHYFPYPRYTDYTSCYEQYEEPYLSSNKMRKYWRKKAGGCSGEAVEHFVQVEPWFQYAPTWDIQRLALNLDEATHRDYTEKLVPRAVGYSAALLNYFFRGKMRFVPDASTPGAYIIQNNSDEKMHGIFSLYYDNRNGDRILIKRNLGYGLLTLDAKQSSEAVTFDVPSDAREPGRYILVFQGTMGSEKGAVAGYVFSRQLEITPPERYLYSLVTAEEAEPQFSWLTATIRNSTADTMKNGSLQAIVRYMTKTGDPSILSARSLPLTDITLGNVATSFTFDFSASPIPVDAKDLLLEVVFTGTIGAEQGAVAQGIRNISEPTPIDIFNNTDRSCINGKWYASSTAEAEAAVDSLGNRNGRADERDIHPHRIRDISIAISSPSESVPATNENHHFSADALEPGQFKRLGHILTETMFRYSNRARWEAVDGTDKWNHFELTYGNEGRAVQEQAEVTSDTKVCGKRVPCSHDVKPQYYDMRGNQMWWGGGLVYVNQLYPAGTSCEGF